VPGVTKPYCNSELSRLKRLSVEAHTIWVRCGRPHLGIVNDNRLLCKSRYKRALRLARNSFKHSLNSKFIEKLLHNDVKGFWSKWNAEFGQHKLDSNCLAGHCNAQDISQGFAEYFASNFYDSASNTFLKDRFCDAYKTYMNIPEVNRFSEFSVNEVRIALASLKKNKAPGLDKISPEMILYAGNNLSHCLSFLFNMCICHSFVPDSFSTSVIVPVVKDKNGKCDSFDNYRPISLVTMFSKVFELCIANRLSSLLNVDELQFGFVSGKGCQKELFTLETVVNYFNCRGSPVYLASLDATKAFDRVNHYALFYKLMCLHIPVYLLNIIVDWHLKLSGYVLWNGMLSSSFCLKSGVRQGGINSPFFFNVYVNDLILKLRKSGFGCHICQEFVGCLFFADDILLLSASILQLQCMLDLCTEYGYEFDIVFNHTKSFLLQFGLDMSVSLPALLLSNSVLRWVGRMKYLGVWLCAGKTFHIDSSINRTKFLSSVYSMFQKCNGISEEIKWSVIERACMPVLLYGVDAVSLSNSDIHKMSVTCNMAVRRCFNLSRFTSVQNVLYFTGSLPVKMLLDERRVLLMKNCLHNVGIVRLCALIACNSDSFLSVCCKYDVVCDMSVNCIKSKFRNKLFTDLASNGRV
jgi:hypothetical protein